MENAEITEITKKLLLFQQKVNKINKDGSNLFFKKPNGAPSTYATISNIVGEIKPILSELGLVLTQPIIGNCVCSCVTDADSGQREMSSLELPAGLNAQQIGSAITYFRRYTLVSLLSLETEEDDDGNGASQQKPEATKDAGKKDDGRPWLSQKQYEQALERCDEPIFLEKLFKEFKMKKEYKDGLNKKAGL